MSTVKKKSLLCRLGLHKWENYGRQVQVFWQEKGMIWGMETHSRMVYEKRRCQRCGVAFKRKLIENPDGTLSSVGWNPDAEADEVDVQG